MRLGTRLLQIVGGTFAICGGATIVAVVIYAAQTGTTTPRNVIVGFPCLVLAVLLWKEQSVPWLLYLTIVSAAFGAFGLWYTIQRTMIHYHTTLSGMPEFTTLGSFLLIPPLLHQSLMILRSFARHGRTNRLQRTVR
jgi:hypothetical protein